MELRENEIKKALLQQRAYLMYYLPYAEKSKDAIECTIKVIDWIIKTFCSGEYVILEKDKLNFLFNIKNNNLFGSGSTTTMNVDAGHESINCAFEKEKIDKELEEIIKNQLIEKWLYDNTL